MVKKITLALIVMWSLGCNAHRHELVSVSSHDVAGCWNHNYEESPEGELLYQLCESKSWRLTRYRNSFILNEDMSAQYLELAPDNGHRYIDGNWTFDDNIITIHLDHNTIKFRYKDGDKKSGIRLIKL